MNIVIDIPRKLYDRYKEKDHIKPCDIDEWEKALDRCITLPSNPTNGEMLMALFPNGNFSLGIGDDNVLMYFQTFDNEWWNAPYERR